MKIDECIQELIQELAPDQGASPSRAFSLVLSLQAALTSRPAETPKTLKASQSSSAWSEAFMVDGDDGPVMGIVIDMPDGRQIWTGECSDKLLSESVDAGESPEGSGIYLSASAKGDGARVIASVGTVNDAEDLARGLAMLWSEAPNSRQCCKELLESLEAWTVEMTAKHGNPNGTDYEQGQNDMGVRIASRLRSISVHPEAPKVEQEDDRTETCVKCCGNGEIVTDWEEYLSPPEGAPADHATADCPACDGIGKVHPDDAHPALRPVGRVSLPPLHDELFYHYESMSAQNHAHEVQQYALAAIAKHKGPQS